MPNTKVKTVKMVDVKNLVGSVFEQVAKRIFKGELEPDRHFRKGDLNPDLAAPDYDAWVEVKGTQANRSFKLHPTQVEGYRRLLETPFPFSNILFALFAHEVYGVYARYGDKPPRQLAGDLVRQTRDLVVLDFSVVDRIIPTLPMRRFKGYGKLYMWDQEINQRFLGDPLAELFRLGLKPDDFKIERGQIPISFARARATVRHVKVLKVQLAAANEGA